MKPVIASSCLALLVAATLAVFGRDYAIAPEETQASPTVSVEGGQLEGAFEGKDKNVTAFLGVPYAAPPVGKLRWRPPQPVTAWSGLRRATEFGPACPQLRANWFTYIGWNEDCLYLNVWSPRTSAGAGLPVLVYFHGGSNTQGYSQMTPLGPVFARMGMVVVSANYRLGPFGFMAHPGLTRESGHHSSGNYGLLDQVQALKWVQEHITRFGGDPARVTVMGQSAGAVDVCLLMASPLAAGLFHGAIMESGECQSTLNKDLRREIPYNSISGTGENAGDRLAQDLGVEDVPDTVERLRDISVEKILEAWKGDPKIHFDAIVDGWVVPEQPSKIFAEGKQLGIPVLTGSNADEATVFGHNGVTTTEEYKNYLRQDTGEYSEQEFAVYPVKNDADVPGQYLQLENDSFTYGAFSIAQSQSRAGEKAYLYCFTYADGGRRASLGAHHGEELFFLSKSFPSDWQSDDSDKNFGEALRTYWAQFVRTGNPNAAGLPHWSAYADGRHQCFELGRAIGPKDIPHRLQTMGKIMQQIEAAVAENNSQSKAK